MGSPDLELRDDGSVVVEAPSVESALEAVQRHCGPDAVIVEAEKVQTKGIAGFFSKQLYRVHVAPAADSTAEAEASAESTRRSEARSAEHAGAPAPDERAVLDASQAVDVVLRRIEAGEHHPHTTFGEALHAELAARGQTPPRVDHPPRPEATATGTGDQVAPGDAGSAGTEQVADLAVADGAHGDERVRTYEDLVRQRAALLGSAAATIDLRDRPATGGGPGPHAPTTGPTGLTGATAALAGAMSPAGATPVTTAARPPLGRPVDEWVPGAGPVRWSLDQLSRLGLPYRLISALGELDPADDLAWVYRLAESAAALCGRMPDEAMVLVGRDSERVATPMGVETTEYPHPPAYEGDVAIAVDGFGDASSFLARVSAGRPLHVVVDGTGFGIELLDPGRCEVPVAVVSMTRDALALGLQAVVAAEAVLGYFVEDDRLVRITPFELALAVRARMPRE